MRILIVFVLLGAASAQTVVLDRIAVTVGTDVITETEVEEEIRVTALLNNDPVDLSPKARRDAAERLVDQDLIRRDMLLSKWPQPESSEAARLLAELKRDRFSGEASYKQALAKYEVTETQLKQHLLWQLAALRYTDYRFRPDTPPPSAALLMHLEAASKKRAQSPRTDEAGTPPREKGTGNLDEQMDAWLKDARSRTRVVYNEDAFR